MSKNISHRQALALPPHVYHLAEATNWQSIQQHGLLSACKLLDLAEVTGADRQRLELSQRLHHTELAKGIQIRDQRPMPPQALASCLIGLTPAAWYALINSRVFFWLDPDRLNRQRAACEPRSQVVLVINTAQIVAAHGQRIALTPINTVNARRLPARRGAATFVPYALWVDSTWASESASLGTPERKRSHRPVELTVEDAVPNIDRFIVDVCHLAPGQSFMPQNLTNNFNFSCKGDRI